jgi:7-cyano-7-deazaguanine synthase
MSVVTLVSGGLDSTLVAKLAQEEGLEQYPLFVDYGQRARKAEYDACCESMKRLGLPLPEVAQLGGFGKLIKSGLTDDTKHIINDAFTPGRNLLFLLTAAAYAYQKHADAIAIGLLNESTRLFPDQSSLFLAEAEKFLTLSLGKDIRIIAPLSEFLKKDVVALAVKKGIYGTYSCHKGEDLPCGDCISCNEFKFKEA